MRSIVPRSDLPQAHDTSGKSRHNQQIMPFVFPSARDLASNNPIVFCEQNTDIAMEIVRNHGAVELGLTEIAS